MPFEMAATSVSSGQVRTSRCEGGLNSATSVVSGERTANAEAPHPKAPPQVGAGAPAVPVTPEAPPALVPAAPPTPPALAPALPPVLAPALPPALAPALPPVLAPALPPVFAPALPPALAPAWPPAPEPAAPPTCDPPAAAAPPVPAPPSGAAGDPPPHPWKTRKPAATRPRQKPSRITTAMIPPATAPVAFLLRMSPSRSRRDFLRFAPEGSQLLLDGHLSGISGSRASRPAGAVWSGHGADLPRPRAAHRRAGGRRRRPDRASLAAPRPGGAGADRGLAAREPVGGLRAPGAGARSLQLHPARRRRVGRRDERPDHAAPHGGRAPGRRGERRPLGLTRRPRRQRGSFQAGCGVRSSSCRRRNSWM